MPTVCKIYIPLISIFAATQTLHLDRAKGSSPFTGMRIFLNRNRISKVYRQRIHQRMAPDARLPWRTIAIHAHLAARPGSANAANIDAAALRAAVAANRRISGYRHSRDLPKRRLHILGIQQRKLRARDSRTLNTISRYVFRLRNRRSNNFDFLQFISYGRCRQNQKHGRKNHDNSL